MRLYYVSLCFFYCLAKLIILQGRAELYFFLDGIQEELFKEKNVTLCGFRAMIFKDQPLYFMEEPLRILYNHTFLVGAWNIY